MAGLAGFVGVPVLGAGALGVLGVPCARGFEGGLGASGGAPGGAILVAEGVGGTAGLGCACGVGEPAGAEAVLDVADAGVADAGVENAGAEDAGVAGTGMVGAGAVGADGRTVAVG